MIACVTLFPTCFPSLVVVSCGFLLFFLLSVEMLFYHLVIILITFLCRSNSSIQQIPLYGT